MTVAPLVVYAGFYLFLVFFAICLATGLYYVAEIVEEYTRLTRKVINYTIKVVVIGIHLLLLVWDRLPILCIAFGVGAHVFYYRMLKTFPYITLTSVDFIGSACLLVISHLVWFQFFLRDPRCAYVSVEWMLGFMLIMLWIVPFAFFISLAANESVLPGAGGPYPYQGYSRLEMGDVAEKMYRGLERAYSFSSNFFTSYLKKIVSVCQ
ncbi:hypothetical protein Mapa_000950 [Marchantia paleacea]|nr:hypothetical protein Mapa_000950 [Marchantia paleacea]